MLATFDCTQTQNISQNTTALLLYDYYLWATCFDSFESSSGPPKNKSKVI